MFGLELTDLDRLVYERELSVFLPAKIIDCHTHVYRKEFVSYGGHNGGSTWTSRVAEGLTAEGLMASYISFAASGQVR